MNAPRIAKATVVPWFNIFPSIPTNASIGRYTIRIIYSPKAADVLIFDADSYTSSPSRIELSLGDGAHS